MKSEIYNRFCTIALEQAGIRLKQGKEAMVAARVQKRLRALGLNTPGQYLEVLEGDPSGEELVNFLDVISTNFTRFFREREHFDLLAEFVAREIEAGQRRFRFWSAASSTGEEPYSMAITLLETIGDRDVDFKVLATDISTKVLAKAMAGVYVPGAVEPLTKAQRCKYLLRHGRPSDPTCTYQAKPPLKEHVAYARLNLSTPPFPMHGPFDVVFCRNVMIYFDTPVRQNLVAEIERLLRPGGLLLTGHSETLTGLSSTLKVLRPSIYIKTSPKAAAG